MHINERNLYNKIFLDIPPLKDPTLNYVTMPYEKWLDFSNQYKFLYCEFPHNYFVKFFTKNFLENTSVLEKQFFYTAANDTLEFLNFYILPDSQYRIDKCIINAIDILKNNNTVYTPPTLNFNLHLHPGQCLNYSCKILEKNIPVLFVKYKFTDIYDYVLNDCKVIKEISSLHDLKDVYSGDIYGYMIKRTHRKNPLFNHLDLDVVFQNNGVYKTKDKHNWAEYPIFNWNLFWQRLQEECSCNLSKKYPLEFFHIASKQTVKLNIPYNISSASIFKNLKIDDLITYR